MQNKIHILLILSSLIVYDMRAQPVPPTMPAAPDPIALCISLCTVNTNARPFCAKDGYVYDNTCIANCFSLDNTKQYDCPPFMPLDHCNSQCSVATVTKCIAERATPNVNTKICANSGFVYDNLLQAQCENFAATTVFSCFYNDFFCIRRCRNARARDNGVCASAATGLLPPTNPLVCGLDGNWYTSAAQAACVGVRVNTKVTCTVGVLPAACQLKCMGKNAVLV